MIFLDQSNTRIFRKLDMVSRISQSNSKEIEIKREKGLIGSSLEAEVLIETDSSTGKKLLSLEVDLKTLFITSDVVLIYKKLINMN